MIIAKLGWSVMRRTLGYGLTRGFILGLIYGPISILMLIALDFLGRVIAGTVPDSQLNLDMLRIYVWTSCLGGSLFGATIGIVSALISAFVQTAALTFYLRRSISITRYARLLYAINAFAVSLITLWATVGLDVSHMVSPDRPIIGWILWVAIPVIFASIASWLGSYQIVKLVNERYRVIPS